MRFYNNNDEESFRVARAFYFTAGNPRRLDAVVYNEWFDC